MSEKVVLAKEKELQIETINISIQISLEDESLYFFKKFGQIILKVEITYDIRMF